MKWVCFSKFYSPLANWPWLRISPQSSLCVIYCLILTAWQWLMSFTCIPVQIEPNKSPLRKRLLVLLLWEIGNLSSTSRSCLGRFIFICGGRGTLRAKLPHTFSFVSRYLLISSLILLLTHSLFNNILFSFHGLCIFQFSSCYGFVVSLHYG